MIWTVTFNPSRDVTLVLEAPLTRGAILRAKPPIVRPGGKGNNVARVARMLGAEVTAVGLYGGAIGDSLVAALAQAGIPTLAGAAAGETRSCLTILDGDGTTTEIREPGPVVAGAAADDLLARLQDRVRPDDWVSLSGSLPPGLPLETWGTWIRGLRSRVRGILVDTAGHGLAAAIAARPTLVTPNVAEWQALGEEDPLIDVVVTDGAQGVVWRPVSGPRARFLPPAIRVQNAVGAGDAFVGGLVWRLARGEAWDAALPWAVAVATASCLTPGVADVDPKMVPILKAEVQRKEPA